MRLLIIADDLTGAADAGAPWAVAGLETVVHWGDTPPWPTEVLVLSTDNRDADTKTALSHSRQAAEAAREIGPELVYQKIDSTLRGHPVADTLTTLEGLNEERLLVAPAFPAQGRTTLSGCQRINGVPLEQSDFAAVVDSSDLVALFSAGARAAIHLDLDTIRSGSAALVKRLEQPGIFIADALSQADLDQLALAAVAAKLRTFCGSAGLAAALGGALGWKGNQQQPVPKSQGPVLIVAGSRHPATSQQVKYCTDQNIPVLGREAKNLAALVRDERIVVLATSGLSKYTDSAEISRQLGLQVRQTINEVALGGLVLTGGETAQAVCNALESSALGLGGEIERGVPWGNLVEGPWQGLGVVSKAGGFGRRETLLKAAHFLQAPT